MVVPERGQVGMEILRLVRELAMIFCFDAVRVDDTVADLLLKDQNDVVSQTTMM